MQVIVALPEDLSLKREASIELSRKSISVTLSGVAVLCGDLPHDIYGEGSDWVVEDELDGFDGTRFLVIDLRKREPFVDWPPPLAADSVGGGRTLVIGGKGEAQKRATGRQCATAHRTPRRTTLCLAVAADAPLLPLTPGTLIVTLRQVRIVPDLAEASLQRALRRLRPCAARRCGGGRGGGR